MWRMCGVVPVAAIRLFRSFAVSETTLSDHAHQRPPSATQPFVHTSQRFRNSARQNRVGAPESGRTYEA